MYVLTDFVLQAQFEDKYKFYIRRVFISNGFFFFFFCLQGCLPLVLMFDVKEDIELEQGQYKSYLLKISTSGL